MSPLFNCVLLGLLATVSVRAQLPGLPGIPGNLLPGLPKLDDLLPCLFKCPCPGATPCVPKLGLDPLVDLSGIEIPIQLNLSCPSLSIEANVCIKLGASCYTSCGTQKTVCDVRIRLCLLTAALKLSLCDPQSLNAHIKLRCPGQHAYYNVSFNEKKLLNLFNNTEFFGYSKFKKTTSDVEVPEWRDHRAGNARREVIPSPEGHFILARPMTTQRLNNL
jgi:hypothetical protein